MEDHRCEICSSPLEQGACAHCAAGLRERFRALVQGEFPARALPPEGALDVQLQGRLRRSLVSGDLQDAERAWDLALASMRPLGAEGRRVLGDCFEAAAALKEALGKVAEAERLRRRAESARKDPVELRRKQSAEAALSRTPSRLNGFEEDTDAKARAERIHAAEVELARLLERRERRLRSFKRAAVGALAGTLAGSVWGLGMAGGALGAGLAWVWKRS
jgi:tetratricopeptide (TPR) repeat protein